MPPARQWRTLLAAALAPLIAGYAVMAALLAIVAALATGTTFETGDVLAAAAPGWLAACHVPLRIGGGSLGVLPLLPWAMVLMLAGSAASRSAHRLRCGSPRDAWPIMGAVAAGHAVLGMVIAVACGSGPVTAPVAGALFICGATGALGAAAGLARPCGLVAAALAHAEPYARHGLRAGVIGLVALLAAGAVTYAMALALSAGTAATLFRALAPGFGSALGLWLLSVCYLPNAIAGALSFVTGAGLDFGAVHASPFGLATGDLPAVPLLAAVPGSFAPWWPVLLLLPLAVGVLVGWSLRDCSPEPLTRVRAVLVAGLTVAVSCLVLAALTGGSLGPAAVRVPAGLLAMCALGWICIPGSVVAWFVGPSVSTGQDP